MFALPPSAIPEFAPPKPTRSTRAASLDEEVDAEEDEVDEEVKKDEVVDEKDEESPAETDEVVVAIGPHLTLKQLKDMCSERSLPTHGKKSELIERLR